MSSNGKQLMMSPDRLRQPALTTGQVARICGVAPRTVQKWIDSGHLHGYRLPGGLDRRVPRDEVVRFLQAAGMPLGPLAGPSLPPVLLVNVGLPFREQLEPHLPTHEMLHVPGAIEAAAALAQTAAEAVLVVGGGTLDRQAARALGLLIQAACEPCPRLVLVISEGWPLNLSPSEWGYRAVLQAPVDPRTVALMLTEEEVNRG